jgi:tetratricopeptide (TPR) repeat protein
MERREVLKAFGLIGVNLATSPWQRRQRDVRQRSMAVDGALLRDIELVTASYERMRHRVPGRALLVQVDGHVAMIKELLQGSLWPVQRQRLLANLSQVASLMSWLQFFDRGDRVAARTWLVESAQAAEEAGDPELCILAMIRAAEQRTYSGQGRDSVNILERAERLAATKGTPKALSWVLSANAEAHATLQELEPCLRLLDRAMGALRWNRLGDDPSWAEYWNRSKVWGYVGASHMRMGRPVDARAGLTEALGEAEELTLKHQSIYLIDLATTYGQEGEPEEACRLASEALSIAGPMHYSTTLERMSGLWRRLEPWRNEPCVRQLDEQLIVAGATSGEGRT